MGWGRIIVSEQFAIDFTSRELANRGMAQTLEVERDEWLGNAIQALRRFAALPEWHEFKTEDFRAWYIAQGFAAPHDHHVWGALTNRACKAGVIRFTNKFAASVSPKTHAHPVKVWSRA